VPDAISSPQGKKTPQGILWIASYPKSGNTWTRLFLHNLFHLLEGSVGDHSINAINEFTTWDIAAKPFEDLLSKPIKSASRQEIARARPAVQADIASTTDGLAIVKTHNALVSDRGFAAINREVTSGAIYLVRNPLDVAVSLAAHLDVSIDEAIVRMATENLETAIDDNAIYEIYGSWSQHVASWTSSPHRTLYVLRYEDMLNEPFSAFGALAKHLLLKPTADQLMQAIQQSSFSVLQRQELGAGFREKPEVAERFFREGRKDQWREKLSRRQVRRVLSVHNRQMRRFGYVTADLAHLV